MTGAPLTLERIPLRAVGPADEMAWRSLAGRARESNPFGLPAYLLPAARTLEGGEETDLLVVRDGSRWLGCVALRTRPKFSDLLLPCVRTWNHPYAFLWTPLVDRDAVDGVAAALVRAPSRWRARAFVALEGIADGPLADALLDAPAAGGTAPFVHGGLSRAAIVRRPHDDYVASHASGKRRRELRRTRRVLSELLGDEPRLVDATDDPEAAERFLALEAGGWKGDAGSALASDPRHAAFFRAVWDGFRARGAAHILELRGARRVAAAVFCVSTGDTVFSLKLGVDEALHRGAPGVHLMADLASWFHERTDADLLDSCAVPEHPMMDELWPDRRELTTVVLPARGALGRAAGALDARVRSRRAMA